MSNWSYPRIVAHRGGGKLAPENTIEAIDVGAQLGLKMIEIDAKLSDDDVVFLLHDDRVDRTSDGQGEAGALRYEQLRALDAGSWFGPTFAGAHMPRLEEVAQRCHSLGLAVNIEIKPSAGRDVETGRIVALEAVRLWPDNKAASDSQPLPLLSSFSYAALEAAAAVAGHLPRGMLYSTVPADWRAQASALGCVSLHANHAKLTEALVAEIKASGLRVLAYTVNEPERARTLASWGVDAICTDQIDLIGADFLD
jgi:glycerophosphoryl diester phosphodiesterase